MHVILPFAAKLAREFHKTGQRRKKMPHGKREEHNMKKTFSTMILAGVVVLLTATFSFAEFAATGVGNFPYFQLGCLIIGGLIIVSLKVKYSRMYLGEAVGAFALYTVLVALFTSPVIDVVKTVVS
jgi:FtsH-binding integral membrane protein